jgi:hypothetical protein
MNDVEKSGVVSAIWILSCNDEKSLMVYESIKFRLGLTKTDEIKEIIKEYGELFRLNLPKSQLADWKDEMKKSSKKGPSYIIEIEDKSEREKEIDDLKPEDGFRSQFRTEANSPKSEVTLISWGLEHIERRRKANLEFKDSKWKWLKEGVLPILSIIVALVAVIASALTQYYNNTKQEELKKYEISFKSRVDQYSSLMDSYEAATESAVLRDGNNLQKNLRQLESEFYKIKPFLSKEARGNFTTNFKQLSVFLNEMVSKENEKAGTLNLAVMENSLKFRNYFSETLYEDLFERSPYVNTPVLWRVR